MSGFEFNRRGFLTAGITGLGAVKLAMAQRRAAGEPQASSPQGMAPPKTARVTSSVMLWTLKGAMEQKLAKAAEAGIQSVELVSEYVSWSDAEVETYKRLAQSYDLTMDALLSQTDWVHRPVTMVNPAHREAFLKDVRDATEWAKKLNVPQVIVLSGNEQPGMTREAQHASMAEGGKRAADIARNADVKLILENLNSRVNHKGYFLTSAKEALQVVKEVDSPHFRFLFDIYHEHVQNGSVIPAIREAVPYVSVFHVADAPGRHDPGTGEMKWDDIYRAIGSLEYAGYIALEYEPKGDEVASLIAAATQMRQGLNAGAAKPETAETS
ncbi:MAG TPA: TIM barrel protein [Bryobacteraceae bacterium]|jgi:hydroxypyruvate isomerase|nr:TIM barrel protein [Bryobacteraceae bacterium]